VHRLARQPSSQTQEKLFALSSSSPSSYSLSFQPVKSTHTHPPERQTHLSSTLAPRSLPVHSSAFLHHTHIYKMAASRIIAPKMASLMGSTAVKAARPMMRSSIKAQVPSQRAFSGKRQLHTACHRSYSNYIDTDPIDCSRQLQEHRLPDCQASTGLQHPQCHQEGCRSSCLLF